MGHNRWERLDSENSHQWRGFQAFLALEHPRCLLDLVEPGRSYSSLKEWSSRNQWFARASALDELDGLGLTKAMVSTKMRVKARQLHILENVADLVDKTFERLAKQAMDKVGPGARVSVKDATSLLRNLINLQQLVIGEATERIEMKGPDLSKLSDEELVQLTAIHDKATGHIN